MWVFVIIAMFVPIALIGYLISRLDRFFARGGFKEESDEKFPAAVVLGGGMMAEEITEILHKNAIQVFQLSEPFLIEQGRNFRYLFALSDSDADNIVICKICRKIYGIKKMISLCNDRFSKCMFESEGIQHISPKNVTAQMLYRLVSEEMEAD